MKNLTFFFVSIFVFCNTLNAQETVELAQLFLGITGVGGSEVVYHTINAEGVVWEKSGSSYIISEDEDIYTSTMYSTGNFSQSNSDTRAPFNWKWLSQQGRVSPWGLGLYKITNSKVSGKYFYLDTRDNEYVDGNENPDLFFVYRSNTGKYHCVVKCDDLPIENGTLVRVSDILGFTSKTDKLEDFWDNVLVLVNDGSNHPRLIWGPFPNTEFIVSYYKIYKKKNSQSFEFYDTSNSPEYIDTDETLLTGPYQTNETVAKYRVTAVGYLSESQNETNPSNEVEARVPGDPPQKIGHNFSSQISEFSLSQNYPNPFNPATVISYSVAENSFVSLKVYDVLGNEISDLVNEVKEPGKYTVSFDASNLSSGIYFYTLKANSNSLTKKMLLAK